MPPRAWLLLAVILAFSRRHRGLRDGGELRDPAVAAFVDMRAQAVRDEMDIAEHECV